jgi:hypothetical protein
MTPTRKATPTAAKSRVRRAPAAQPAAGGFIRVRHGAELHQRCLDVLGALEAADDATSHRDPLSALILELTGNALSHCFMQPLRRTRPGLLMEQSASLGLLGVQQLMAPVVRQVIGHMDARQLLSVSKSIREFMR